MKIMVLGGDGYLGWPTALHLSECGHEVAVVDNFAHRAFDLELGTGSLVPIEELGTRLAVWRELTGKAIAGYIGDLVDYDFTRRIISDFRPAAVVHFAEQCSAPYAMIDRKHAVYTQVNNVAANMNILFSMVRHVPDAHLLKMGCYDEETEVLTREAWKHFWDLEFSEEVCCLDAANGEVTYSRPSNIVA